MSEIKPALSPEEWRKVLDYAQRWGEPVCNYDEALAGVVDSSADTLHYLAALALHGQTFGFTWEDVDMLRGVAKTAHLMMENRPDGYWSGDVARADKLAADLADRIAALLPPREP